MNRIGELLHALNVCKEGESRNEHLGFYGLAHKYSQLKEKVESEIVYEDSKRVSDSTDEASPP